MAKGAYLGIGDTARKVKNIYVGAGVNTYQKTVTATEFQQGALLYSSGNLDTSFTDYVSTTNFYEASYGNVVKIISSKVTPLEDSGFLWYDSNYNFISGNKGTVSGQFVSGEPPVNTAYFKFNLNAASVTPSTASGTGFAVYSVARKIKKAYIGDANGLARLCWSGSGIPNVTGNLTLSSRTTIMSISGLEFEPVYVFCFDPSTRSSSGTWYQGMISDVPKSGQNYGRLLINDYPSSVYLNYGQNSYSNGTLTLTANHSTNTTTMYFTKGTYYYTVVGGGDGDNVLYGTTTLSAASSTLTVNIGEGKTVVDVKIYGDTGDPSTNCSYAVYNNRVYGGTYESEYGTYSVVSTTKNYSVNNGVLTLNAYSSSYKFPKGTYYYCIVLG